MLKEMVYEIFDMDKEAYVLCFVVTVNLRKSLRLLHRHVYPGAKVRGWWLREAWEL